MHFEIPSAPPAIVRRISESAEEVELPHPEMTVMPGVQWGRPDVLFTPAYWKTQLSHRPQLSEPGANRLGRTFREEVVACLLGGHGLPAEVGVAAFKSLRDSGVMEETSPTSESICGELTRPLTLQDGRTVRYRFPKTKSKSIADFLGASSSPLDGSSHREVRDWLTTFHGIGPKTASWIVRNWFDSDSVAILDIHIQRAGIYMGLFGQSDSVVKHYRPMEIRFLILCQRLSVKASALDALIWHQMRSAGRLALDESHHYHARQ